MNISWPNLPGALLGIAAGLLILAGLVGLAVWDARRRKSRAVIVDVAGAVARVWVAFTGVAVILTIWQWVSEQVWVPDVPVYVDVPELSCAGVEPPVGETSATLVCGSVNSADLTVVGMDAGLRAIFAAGNLLGLVVVAVPGIVLAVACRQTLRGTPFARVVSRWLVIGAVTVLVAGFGGELLLSLGRTLLSRDLFDDRGTLASPQVYSLSVSLWPCVAAFAFAALGAIFRHGERLQRDTEALV